MMWDYPIYLFKYARDNYIIDKPGLKQFLRYVNNTKKMNCLLKTVKAKQLSNTVKIKFGINITCDHKKAMIFYSDHINTNWENAELLELKQIYNFKSFDSLGPLNNAFIPPGHNKIQVHLIYNYKQDGRYKSLMVASGNMTGTNIDTNYSSIISIRFMRTVFFLAKMSNIETRTGDLIHSYLTERTNEKIVFNA